MMNLKKAASIVLTAAMVSGMGLVSVPVYAESAVQHHKIGVGLYVDSGRSVDAIKEYLAGISEAVDCEFVYTTLSTYDEASSLSEVQNLIASGCEGIIITADMGMKSIMQECEAAGVYVAGFLCDYNLSYNTQYDEVFGSDNFLGTVCDGWRDQSPYADIVAEKVIENGYKNIGTIIFPEFAFPNQVVVDQEFRTKIAEYNETVGDDEKINLVDTQVNNFTPLEDTYLNSNPQLDCIFAICAGAGNVYPVMVAAGRTDIKLYTQGFEGTEDADNFGSHGNQCYQGIMFSTPEAIVYPLCLLIDKLNGTVYSDLPEEAEVVDCSPMLILSDEDLEKVEESAIYYTVDYEDALIKGEEVVDLCASYNPEASYSQLLERLNHLGVEDLQ